MDIEGPSTQSGANIQVWSFTSSASQKKWVFTRQSDGSYTIRSVYSGKYVEVNVVGSSPEGDSVVQLSDSTSDAVK